MSSSTMSRLNAPINDLYHATTMPVRTEQGYTSRPLQPEDAMRYLDDIKDEFKDQPHVFNQFLGIMQDFKYAPQTALNTVKRVCDLFNGHPDLIRGFELFLPPRYLLECTYDEAGVQQVTLITPETYKKHHNSRRHAKGSR